MIERKEKSKEVRPRLISCGILRKEIGKLVEEGSLDVDPHFLGEGLHSDYGRLEKALRGALEEHLKDCQGRVIVVYGDLCLGFNNEMRELMGKYGVVKVDALNCIDCLLGGKGRLLKVDPKHEYLFLNPAWIKFSARLKIGSKEEARKLFSVLKGIVLIDSLGDLDDYKAVIEDFSDYVGLPILERKEVGLDGLRGVLIEAINRLNERECL